MDTHTETKTEAPARPAPRPQEAVRLDDKLLLSYASSMMRLLIFMEHCGPNHPCTMNETRLFRRYDAALTSRHDLLNSGIDRSAVSASIASYLIKIAKPTASTFDLEPDFEAEIVAKFVQNVRTRFSA